MKLDPPRLTVGPFSDAVFVVTHGKVEPHPTIPDRMMVTATVKYDVTEQFTALASERSARVEQVEEDKQTQQMTNPSNPPSITHYPITDDQLDEGRRLQKDERPETYECRDDHGDSRTRIPHTHVCPAKPSLEDGER